MTTAWVTEHDGSRWLSEEAANTLLAAFYAYLNAHTPPAHRETEGWKRSNVGKMVDHALDLVEGGQ